MGSKKVDAKYELGTRVVPVKLTPTERAVLDQLVTDGTYDSRSAAIRAALGMLFEHWEIPAELDLAIEHERQQHKPRFSNVVRDAAKPEPKKEEAAFDFTTPPKAKKGKKHAKQKT